MDSLNKFYARRLKVNGKRKCLIMTRRFDNPISGEEFRTWIMLHLNLPHTDNIEIYAKR